MRFHFYPISSVLFSLLLFAEACSPVSAQNIQTTKNKTEPAYDSYSILFFEAERPYFIQLQIKIDRQSPSAFRTGLLSGLFNQTDLNQDGQLDKQELAAFQGAERMQAVVARTLEQKQFPWSQEAFIKQIEPTLGLPFGLQSVSARVSDLPDLFQQLDLDQNSVLEKSEWTSALHLLNKFDFDDDETLNLIEVMPLLRPLNLGVQSDSSPAGSEAGLFTLLTAESPFKTLAQQLVAQYDGQDKETTDGQLGPKELGFKHQKQFDIYDANQDGALNLSEIEQLLRSPPAQRVWRIRIPLQKRLTVRFWETQRATEKWKIPRSARSRKTVSMGNWELQVQVENSRPQFADTLAFYQLQFLQADSSKDGKLSKDEAAALRLGVPFEGLDTDADGMLTRQEVTAYIQQDSALSQCQLLMTVDKQSQSLFRMLDVDHDRRLEPRELKNPTTALKSFDQNQDGKLTQPEMKSIYQLKFKLQMPRLFMNELGNNRANQILPILSQPTAGPEWFRRMDRNLDGDLTHREFLGPTALFSKLDKDGDLLISAAEAEQTE